MNFSCIWEGGGRIFILPSLVLEIPDHHEFPVAVENAGSLSSFLDVMVETLAVEPLIDNFELVVGEDEFPIRARHGDELAAWEDFGVGESSEPVFAQSRVEVVRIEGEEEFPDILMDLFR